MILTATSPFFKSLFRTIKHPHPFVYMRGVKSEDLLAILDFLYCGEANVFQENLNTFLEIAEELKLKGLMGSTDNDLRLSKHSDVEMAHTEKMNTKAFSMVEPETKSRVVIPHKTKRKDYGTNPDGDLVKGTDAKPDDSKPKRAEFSYNPEGGFAHTTDAKPYSEYIQELDQTVKSMIEKSEKKILVGKQLQRVNICKVCGKEGQWVAIRDHIEANHLQGVSLSCSLCEKSFRSRKMLRTHKSSNHKHEN